MRDLRILFPYAGNKVPGTFDVLCLLRMTVLFCTAPQHYHNSKLPSPHSTLI